MGAFEYTAVDATGRERKGVLEGDTARSVRQMLRDQSLLPVSVNEVLQTETKRERQQFSLRRGISAADLSLLTRHIATLVRSGLPLEEALMAVSEQTERPRIRSIVMGVRAKVMEGHSLADGLSDFPAVFPELYRATVSAGEQSGHLDTVLERLADYTESREQMRSRTLTAMLYPVLLFIVCVSIVAMLLTFVVPKIVKQFENSKAELTGALLRARDRLDGGFEDAPPDGELSERQRGIWDVYTEGRISRLGFHVNEPRRRYSYRLRAGFNDVADSEYEQLWAATALTWAQLSEIEERLVAADPRPATKKPLRNPSLRAS